MRVVAGEYRGLRLATPNSNDIRPTMDRAKEGLFNVINQDIYMADFLDLFAGTGSIGVEALSRGANHVVFVEQDKYAMQLINENTKKIDKEFKIIRNDVVSYVKHCQETFDYIFLDPPYDLDVKIINEIVEHIITNKLLKEDGQIIIEFKTRRALEFPCCEVIKFKKYGISSFTFLKENHE